MTPLDMEALDTESKVGRSGHHYYGANAAFLDDFKNMWIHLTLWSTGIVAVTFFFSGCWSARVSEKKCPKMIWVPLLSLFVGALFGFMQSSIFSVLIAALLRSIPLDIGIETAAAIGIAIGLVFLYFHMGRATFVHW